MSSLTETIPRDAYLSWTEIDLNAIRTNYQTLRDELSNGTAFFPVVKADAYGHGAISISKLLENDGAERICVARVEEALELRQNGITCKILVFAPPFVEQARLAGQFGLEVVVCDPCHIEAVSRAQSECQKAIPVHLKVDIGMGRIGARPEDVLERLETCEKANLQVVAVMSHFPCADGPDPSVTLQMNDLFGKVRNTVLTSGRRNLIFHTANTAALLRFPESHFDAVRSGISLYGQYPDVSMDRTVPLVPAMTLFTKIVFIKDVPAGTAISYCQGYRTPTAAKIATVALGYADGLPRHSTNHTGFYVREQYVPQVGRVCMDQVMLDVTHLPDVSLGDRVMVFGKAGAIVQRAEDFADRFGTIGYELTTRIGKRLPKFIVDSRADLV